MSRASKMKIKKYRKKVDDISRDIFKKYGWMIYGHLFMAAYEGGYLGDANRDHKFSVAEGRRLGIPARIIANPINIRIIPRIENEKKGAESVVSLDELFEGYRRFVEICGMTGAREECLSYINKYYEGING